MRSEGGKRGKKSRKGGRAAPGQEREEVRFFARSVFHFQPRLTKASEGFTEMAGKDMFLCGFFCLCVLLILAGEVRCLETHITDSSYSAVAQIARKADFDLPRYTLFAPNNAAFQRLGCLSLWNETSLAGRILEYHLLDQPYSSEDILDLLVTNESWNPSTVYKNAMLQLSMHSNTISINEARVVALDLVQGYSKSVHAIDAVLIPPGIHLPADCANFKFQFSAAPDKLAPSIAVVASAFLLGAAILKAAAS